MPDTAPAIVKKSIGLNPILNKMLEKLPPDIRDGYHPSDMAEFCPIRHFWVERARMTVPAGEPERELRRQIIRQLLIEKRNQFKGGSIERILDTGHLKHIQYQHYLGLLGYIRGRWACSYCHAKAFLPPEFYMPRVKGRSYNGSELVDLPAPCPRCGGRNIHEVHPGIPPWFYDEPASIRDLISGHSDGLVILPGVEGNGILELKGINSWHYSGKPETLPKESHRWQTNQYAYALRADYIWFVYISKDTDAVKDFVEPLQPKYVQHALANVRTAEKACKRGKPPSEAHRACPSIKDKRAQVCPAVEQCFGSSPPANLLNLT